MRAPRVSVSPGGVPVGGVVLVGVLCALLTSGCSLVTTMWGPPEGFVSLPKRPPSVTGLTDFRGVVHCHSFRSRDSTGTIEEIGAACASVGMDFLIMTDHPSPYSVIRGKRGMVGDTLFLVGSELRVPGGTLLAFPLKHYVRPHATLQGYLDDIHGQGGLAFIGHAEQFQKWEHPGIDGVEIHNLHAAAKAAPTSHMVTKVLFAPLGTLFTSLTRPDEKVIAAWDKMSEDRVIPAVAGNDAHANIRLLGPMGWVLGNYDEVFRVVSTHVLADRLDEVSIVSAIRAGRTYVSMDLWWDGSGFAFWAAAGAAVYEMGATVPMGSALRVRCPEVAGSVAEIRVLRRGRTVLATRGIDATHVADTPGVYRVEVWLDDALWIASSGIRVR